MIGLWSTTQAHTSKRLNERIEILKCLCYSDLLSRIYISEIEFTHDTVQNQNHNMSLQLHATAKGARHQTTRVSFRAGASLPHWYVLSTAR